MGKTRNRVGAVELEKVERSLKLQLGVFSFDFLFRCSFFLSSGYFLSLHQFIANQFTFNRPTPFHINLARYCR